MRIAILGVGLIGGSVGLAARGADVDAQVIGFDPDPAALERAVARGALDEGAGSVEAALAGADFCFACAPVGELPALVARALPAAAAECVVTDVGSTKRAIADRVDDERFIGGHPIAGSETAGIGAARGDLFAGAAWYLTPGPRSAGVLYDRLHRLLVALGARPVAIDAKSHDRLLATVSHLPHVLANVLVEQAASSEPGDEEALPNVGPSLREMTRVAGANSDIWTDIYTSNVEAITAAIDDTRARLARVGDLLRRGDAETIRRWNDAARRERDRQLAASQPGGPVSELRVSVPNRPGIVGELAVALGKAGVNIVDMALAPAPDNRSGAISFWIAGERSAERARALLEDLGLPVGGER